MNKQKLSYEEQVTKLGNGKRLAPGCYDENMNWMSDTNKLLDFPYSIDKNLVHHVILPEETTKIENYMFLDCKKLESVVLPDQLEEIGEFSFGACSELKEIQIPDSVKRIGDRAFQCSGLVSLFLPASVESLGYGICIGCRSLVTFCMPEANLTEYSTLLMFCEDVNLTEVILPEGIEKIEDHAFHCCTSLKKILLPKTVKEIHKFAFAYCESLACIGIPSGIEFISQKAFGPASTWKSKIQPIIEVAGYEMTLSDIAEKPVVNRIQDVVNQVEADKKPKLTEFEIKIVMQALAGNPIVTSSEFANKVEQILRQ